MVAAGRLCLRHVLRIPSVAGFRLIRLVHSRTTKFVRIVTRVSCQNYAMLTTLVSAGEGWRVLLDRDRVPKERQASPTWLTVRAYLQACRIPHLMNATLTGDLVGESATHDGCAKIF